MHTADLRLGAGQVVEDIEVEERYLLGKEAGTRGREYKVAMRFADPAKYPPEAGLSYEEVLYLPLFRQLFVLRAPCSLDCVRFRSFNYCGGNLTLHQRNPPVKAPCRLGPCQDSAVDSCHRRR